MGQVETKVFVDAPPWDLEELDKITDLEKSTVNLLWRKWATDPATRKGKVKFDTFASELCVNLEDEKEVEQAKEATAPCSQYVADMKEAKEEAMKAYFSTPEL